MNNKLVVFWGFFFLVACDAGDGTGLDINGNPIQEPPNSSTDIQPTLASIQEHVFTPICSVCHGAINPAAGQNLSSTAETIANTINVPSSNPEFDRIEPGSPEQSYLYLKIAGDARAGARMPLGQAPLDDETISIIRQWIENGAPTEVLSAPAQVMVAKSWQEHNMLYFDLRLSHQIDLNSVDQYSVILLGKQGGISQLMAEWAVKFQVSANRIKVQVELPEWSLTAIELQLNNSAWSTLLSASGTEIDGNANGFPGGMYRYEHVFEQ